MGLVIKDDRGPAGQYVRPADARTLCGKSVDWVEALGS